MNILNIVCIFFYLGRIWGQEQKYVVLAPKVFHIAASERVVVQVHGYTESFAVSVAIKSYPDKSFTYSHGQVYLSPENKFQGSTSLTIQLKDLSGGPNTVSHVYLEVTCAHFSKSTPIPLCYDNGFIFVQTDKSVYSSREPVKVRAYALNEDLKPSQREVILTFIDPEGNETSTVGKNIYPGINTFLDFQMQPFPKYGLWTIKAKYKEDFTTTGTAQFELKIPDIYSSSPIFTVLIEPEDDFISHKIFEDFKITVRAGYYLNKNVPEGDVFVFFGIKENLDDNEEDMMLAGTQKTQLIDGVAQVHFNTSEALRLLNKNIEEINHKYLNIYVEVQKTGHFTYENKVADVKYVLFPYSIDLVASPLVFKPGIPFSIKVQVKNVVGHVVKGLAVTLKAKTVQKTAKTDLDVRRSETNSDGVASFVINIPSDVTTLDFHVRTDDPDLPEEYQAREDYQATAYAGHSQTFLSLSRPDGDKSLLVRELLNVIVTLQSPYADRITYYNYLISSRGKIRHFGTMKKLPGSPSQPLKLLVTQHMAPEACLFVYFFIIEDQRTELVSDSVCLKVEEKCGNPLQIRLSPSRDSPSPNNISLILESQSEAWVALSSVDFVTYHFEERRENFRKRILQSAQKSGQNCGAGGGRNNAEGFYSMGLTVLTNMPAENSPQDDGSFTKTLRSKRNLDEEINKKASTFKHPKIQQCCHNGAHETEESCWERAERVRMKIGPGCSRAFSLCCVLANTLRGKSSHVDTAIGRLPGYRPIRPKRRSENWLWRVYYVPQRYQVELTLPDSLTTWEIQGISISDNGLCVPGELQLKVSEDSFLVTNNNVTETFPRPRLYGQRSPNIRLYRPLRNHH